METVLAGQYILFPQRGFRREFSPPPTHTNTHPCRVLAQVAASVLHRVGVPQLLKELHLFDDILPFLQQERQNNETIKGPFGPFSSNAPFLACASVGNNKKCVPFRRIVVRSQTRREAFERSAAQPRQSFPPFKWHNRLFSPERHYTICII